ncbi:penicillin-binding protein 1B [uncultured Endozoicomonas sp.]|uniref:penicillin-binding protein 1B n=1 Tax=uncultured Endozoicomonas sp. TaxID=432652 RepID=UPI00260D8957|nr:penicillin-binding protein 1B [uncultured Endozoicomonas sp.]
MAKKTTTKKTGSPRKKRQGTRTPSRTSWRSILFKAGFTLTAIVIAYAAYLDAVVTRQFEGKKWAIPAKVFARPLELYSGKRITPADLQSQLKRQGYQAVQQVSRPGTFARAGNRFVIYSRGFHFPDGAEPSRYASVQLQNNEVVQLRSNGGTTLPLLRLDPQPIGGIYPASYEDRLLIRSTQTPRYLIPSLLAIEDRDYYDHFGLSPTSIARAMVANVRAGGVVQGGSTITQQLVKNFFLTNDRTLVRKAKEAIMALLLELHYSKEEILETYLNEVYLGQHGRRAIHGFGLASQFYFAQPIQELNLARTALLVAIVKGPSYFDPRRYSERALERRNLVLDVMAERGIVPQAEVDRSKKLPLGVVSRELVSTNDFPAYIDLVKEQLRKDYDEKDLTSEGLRIFTNLDPIIQREAQKSVSATVKSLGKGNQLQGAMVISSAQTGDLLAVVGDKNAGYAGFNRAVEARRPVGSLLKPAIYLTALERPEQYTLTTMVNDTSVKINDGKGGYWEPKNYSRESHGQVPLYLALAKSYNQAAANTGMAVGLSSVQDTLKRLGVEQRVPPYPSVLLGALSMTPIEVATMYQTIASGGFRMPIRAIDAVVDSQGRPLSRYSISVERAFNPGPMELLRTALGVVMSEGTGRRIYQYIEPDIALGGKTGTTNDLRDSWFAGYSGDLVAVSWIGHDDNSPTKLTGSSGALKIWGNFLANVPVQPVAPLQANNLTSLWVNPAANGRSHQYCEGAMELPYITGSEPKAYAGCGKDSDDSLFDRIKAWF